MKVCPKCRVGTDFYRNASRPDGLQTWCKICFDESSKKQDPDRVRAVKLASYHRRKGLRQKPHPAKPYDQKTKARRLLQYAVRRGTIRREPCEHCGNPKSQGHHEDYAQPLRVRWLCSTCHAEHHRAG